MLTKETLHYVDQREMAEGDILVIETPVGAATGNRPSAAMTRRHLLHLKKEVFLGRIENRKNGKSSATKSS